MSGHHNSDSQSHNTSSFQDDARAYPYVVELSEHDTDKLLVRQKQYEGNPSDY